VNKEMRNVFINTVTIQFTNYPRGILPWFVNDLKVNGIGLGGPDVFLEDKGLLQGVYPYYSQVAGDIPLAPSVQHQNYLTRTHNGDTSNPPTVEELYRFARDNLHANYLFWTRRVYPDSAPYLKVLEMFDSPSFPKDPAGGLATGCPKVYASCFTNAPPSPPSSFQFKETAL